MEPDQEALEARSQHGAANHRLPYLRPGRAGLGQTKPPSPFLSPNELAERWRCARSSVDRITRRAGLRRVYLGGGTRGMVRYLREEVERYENSRLA